MNVPSLLRNALFPALAFVAGVLIADACATHARSPDQAPPAAKANVLESRAGELRIAPNGKASIRILAKGQQAFFGLLKMNPGAEVGNHRDVSEEFIYVLKGSGDVVIDGKSYPVGPDMLIYMPAGAEVSFRNSDQPLEALQVFAGTESAGKYERWKPAGATNPGRPGPGR